MGTFYGIASKFRIKLGTDKQELERAFAARIARLLSAAGLCQVEARHEEIYVVLQERDHMAYSRADALDLGWVSLIEDYADLAGSPVAVTSGGDDYSDGLHTWLVGSQRAVLEHRLTQINQQMAELNRRKKSLLKALKRGGDAFFAEI